MDGVSTQNTAGEWVPAIPEPYWGGKRFVLFGRRRCQCYEIGCKRWFWTKDGFRGHYALAHILKLGRP